MTWQKGVLLGLTVASAASAWYAVFFLYPRVGLSLFRYRLWRLRDDLYDDLELGAIPRCESSLQTLATVERVIANAESVSLSHFVIWRWAADFPPLDEPSFITRLDDIAPADAEKICGYLQRLNVIMVKRLKTAGPFGWLSVVLLPAAYVLHAWRYGRRPVAHPRNALVQTAVRERLRTLPQRVPDERQLSHFV